MIIRLETYAKQSSATRNLTTNGTSTLDAVYLDVGIPARPFSHVPG